MSLDIIFAVIISSIATYSSRFFGALTSEVINENSKIYRWFNCLAYSTLSALIARSIIFPAGVLSESDYLIRFTVIFFSILITDYSNIFSTGNHYNYVLLILPFHFTRFLCFFPPIHIGIILN